MATVNGGAYGNVSLSAQANGDLLQAFGWNNTLFGNGLNVTFTAGQGQSQVYVGQGSNGVSQTVNLGGWNDLVQGSNTTPPGATAGANENITVSGGQGSSTVQLGNGNDNVNLAGWTNFINLGDGTDTIVAGSGNSTVFAGDGNDAIQLGGWGNLIRLGNGSDTLSGISGGSTVTAGNGNNLIQISGWSDLLNLGSGSNTVTGISGSSTINAGNGNNSIIAGGWGNAISVGGGANTIVAGAGSDSVTIGGGANAVSLSGWGNYVNAVGGADTIQSGAGSDTISLSGSNVMVVGGANARVVLGGTTMDTVIDQQQGMTVVIGPNSPSANLTFGADANWVVDFVGGAGGFANAQAVLNALQANGGTTTLSVGTGGATVTFNQAVSTITAAHIKIG